MFGLEIHSLPAVLILLVVLGWVAYLVWRTIDRLVEVSRRELGPTPEPGHTTKYGLREAERRRAEPVAR
ncbi:hypothetical protein [Amaricoccus sp.]|uniref:hypothetical protein n=1 Tax=Amaricoccus sp. TaxID=1872485 RepID=UPI0025C6A4D3|nr:hypothetical protein [Amaricoccus sp.]